MTHTIRLAMPPDHARIIEIYNQAIPGHQATAELTPVTVEQRQSWFEQHQGRYPLFVIEVEAQISAWGSLSHFYSGRGAYFETAEVSVYVANDYQGKSIGRIMLEYLINQATNLGFRRLVALVFAHNPPSLAMCHRCGFIRWGYLPGVANMSGVLRDVEILGLCLDNSTPQQTI